MAIQDRQVFPDPNLCQIRFVPQHLESNGNHWVPDTFQTQKAVDQWDRILS